MESLLKRQNTEDRKPKADLKQLLNDIPKQLNDLARICRENTKLMSEKLGLWGETAQVLYMNRWDLNSQLPVQKHHRRVILSIVLWKYPFISLTETRGEDGEIRFKESTPHLNYPVQDCIIIHSNTIIYIENWLSKDSLKSSQSTSKTVLLHLLSLLLPQIPFLDQ